MKTKLLFLGTLIIGFMAVMISGCTKEPYESCENETIEECNHAEVTACCTDDNGIESCVYKYNGKEYSSLKELYDALDCGTEGIAAPSDIDVLRSSVSTEEIIKLKLAELMERAHAGLKAQMQH